MPLWGWNYIGGSSEPARTVYQAPPKTRAASALFPTENSINLLREFLALAPNIGSWVVVRKFFRDQKCSCRRQRTGGQPDPTCALCAGAGFPYHEYPVYAYLTTVAMFNSLMGSQFTATMGTVSEEPKIGFFPVSSRIATSDFIFEVALTGDQKIKLPIQRLGAYDVSIPVSMRADRIGDIDYLMVNMTEREFGGLR